MFTYGSVSYQVTGTGIRFQIASASQTWHDNTTRDSRSRVV